MKKRLNKKYISLSLAFLLLVSLIQLPRTASAVDAPIEVNADAAIIVEASTGKILYGKNIDTALGIASMTKMMTEYLMFEAIKEGKISWEQEQIISEYVHKVSVDSYLSNVGLQEGKPYTIKELYESMAIYSANGSTIAIAEAIAGTETEFVKMMNAKAEELGLDNYNFVNSTGLNNSDLKGMHPDGTGPEDENVLSARSTAKLASRLMKDFPDVLNTSSIPRKKFRDLPGEMKNWNLMLPGLEYEYPGVDGLKTGTTNFAGKTFTGTAKQGDFRIITVVMNAKDENGNSNDRGRFGETAKMMNYAFQNFSMKEILPNNYEIEGHTSLAVDKGKEDKVDIKTNESLSIVVKNGEESTYKPVFTIDESKLNKDGNLTAPVKEGDVVGTLEPVHEGDGDLGYLDKDYSPKINVVTTDDVEKANWFTLSMRAIGGFFADLWTSITDTVKGWF